MTFIEMVSNYFNTIILTFCHIKKGLGLQLHPLLATPYPFPPIYLKKNARRSDFNPNRIFVAPTFHLQIYITKL